MKVKDLLNAVDAIAPFALTMDFDNTGLLIGDPDAEVSGVMLALDCTQDVLTEAKKQGANLILTHHPVIFHGIKQVQADSVVYQAIRSGIHVISAHTNLDIAQGGVNDCLARRLGLEKVEGLTAVNQEAYDKVTVFVPESHSQTVYQAMSAAGAGTVENYSGCAFLTEGEGCFLPMDGAHPYLGKVGEKESVREIRIEMVCVKSQTPHVIQAMKAAHPYEIPAYDIFEDRGIVHRETLGRVGLLPAPMEPRALAKWVKNALDGTAIRFCMGKQPISKVAVCGGAGDSELESAIGCGAQALVTGEVKHHIFMEAAQRSFTLIEAGHFHTEAVVLDGLKERLAAQFPELNFSVYHQSVVQTM